MGRGNMIDKESLGIVGLIILAGMALFTEHAVIITLPAITALIAYLAGNINGKKQAEEETRQTYEDSRL